MEGSIGGVLRAWQGGGSEGGLTAGGEEHLAGGGVDDGERLRLAERFALERKPRLVVGLDFADDFGVIGAKTFEHGRVNANLQVHLFLFLGEEARQRAQTALDVHRQLPRRLDDAMPAAVRAGGVRLREEALFEALARHFEQAQFGNRDDVGARLVVAARILERTHHLLLVFARLHVDEVDDDEPADIADAQLARHLFDGFEVDLQNGVLLRALALVLARVDIHGDKGFGFIDDEIAARFERNLPAEGFLDLRLDAVVVEDGVMPVVELDEILVMAGDAGAFAAEAFVDDGIIDPLWGSRSQNSPLAGNKAKCIDFLKTGHRI